MSNLGIFSLGNVTFICHWFFPEVDYNDNLLHLLFHWGYNEEIVPTSFLNSLSWWFVGRLFEDPTAEQRKHGVNNEKGLMKMMYKKNLQRTKAEYKQNPKEAKMEQKPETQRWNQWGENR